jgi:ABC-type arginine/histidine transport system permease subunit
LEAEYLSLVLFSAHYLCVSNWRLGSVSKGCLKSGLCHIIILITIISNPRALKIGFHQLSNTVILELPVKR